jgi:phosphinothricin acetyltransferase
MSEWFDGKERAEAPVLGAVDGRGQLLGFATYGPFRAFDAYKYTVESSVYVEAAHQGQGIATALMRELIRRADGTLHCMIAAIEAGNTESTRLHEKLGFERNGMLPQVGYKFGRWLDLWLYQLLLSGPRHPNEQ